METLIRIRRCAKAPETLGIAVLLVAASAAQGAGVGAGIANPASENCIEKGGTSEIRNGGTGGEYGVCIFSDGSKCEEWALMKGECSMGDSTGGSMGMANPASVFCEEHDGASDIRTDDEEGQYGICVFSDGSECEEWAYMKGECSMGDSTGGSMSMGMANSASVFCEEHDGTSDIRTDDEEGQYGVCIFSDGSECEEWAFMRGECSMGDSTGGVSMANPASIHCEEQGGKSELRTDNDGEYGVCIFSDMSECEEWAFMTGECSMGNSIMDIGLANPASMHCEEQGGKSEIRTEEMKGEYSVCVFTDGSECEEWAFMNGECSVGDSKGSTMTMTTTSTVPSLVGNEVSEGSAMTATSNTPSPTDDSTIYTSMASAIDEATTRDSSAPTTSAGGVVGHFLPYLMTLALLVLASRI